jgi:hypothetical protein
MSGPKLESFRKVCRLIGLPMPGDSDIAPIKSGLMLPLEDYGCLLRIEEVRNDEKIRYPLGIMPVISFRLNNREVSYDNAGLYPAIPKVGITPEDFKKLRAIVLEQLQLHLMADAEDDCAYISRTPQEGFPNGVPVVIDFTDAVQIKQYIDIHDPETQEPLRPFHNAQFERFYTLREGADSMLSAYDESEFQQRARDFWKRMHRMTGSCDSSGARILSACWKNAQPGTTKLQNKLAELSEPSASYARRLRSDRFHDEILAPAA